ncbi:MAG: ADP-ribosylglycohydrolase family protein [Syntrophobacteraceae bacterium]
MPKRNYKRTLDHFAGCLVGGAIGDALGAPLEFMSLHEIRQRYGGRGITGYEHAYGRKGAITDDTQMTLFTAEGLLDAEREADIIPFVHDAYLRWLHTQGYSGKASLNGTNRKGRLIEVGALHARRAPGNSCLSALLSGKAGTVNRKINDSKGCGGVMRVAPVGLFYKDFEKAFEKGCEAAAITHGHPTGFLAAGCLACMISLIISGDTLQTSIHVTMQVLRTKPRHEECLQAIENTLKVLNHGEPSGEIVERIGAGWVAEEALAIAIYAAWVANGDFEKGVLLAVNHSGDSDSTGSITGNILGALSGKDAIPANWLEKLELREVIEEISSDLLARSSGDQLWKTKYPVS